MDTSKVEKWSPSPSSNLYDDLRAVNSLPRPKVPSRSTSTISYISPREVEIPSVKRSTVSLIVPTPILSNEPITKLETILSIDNTKRSKLFELEHQDSKINKKYDVFSEEQDQSCLYWLLCEMIRLICMGIFVCFIVMFIFTLIFYAFDVYWLEQPIDNHSFWWFDHNGTNFTDFDYDMISTTQTIDYDEEY